MSLEILGILMIAIGLFFAVCGKMESQFSLYQLFVERSKILWGDNVYVFHQVSGALIVIVGISMLLGFT